MFAYYPVVGLVEVHHGKREGLIIGDLNGLLSKVRGVETKNLVRNLDLIVIWVACFLKEDIRDSPGSADKLSRQNSGPKSRSKFENSIPLKP